MHGCFQAVLVYGVLEPYHDRVLETEFLFAHDMENYPVSLVRLYATSFVYGIAVPVTGAPPEILQKVDEFVSKLRTVYAMDVPDAELHLALCGDYDFEQIEYTPKTKK